MVILWPSVLVSQVLLKPAEGDPEVTLMPNDQSALDSGDERNDLACTVTEIKPQLGFDLKFHAGYEVAVPLREIAGAGDRLTVLFRVYPEGRKEQASYFVQRFNVPEIQDDAKGDATLQGVIDMGPGKYHVDWLMRDRLERVCSNAWDSDATVKDHEFPLFLDRNQVAQYQFEPFINEHFVKANAQDGVGDLNLKVLVNFAPQLQGQAELRRTDVDALLTILRAMERDPHVRSISLVAFNIEQGRIVYRQDTANAIDYPALGKALRDMPMGTVNVGTLSDKHADTAFLENLIVKEVATGGRPDAIVFAGPKAMLNADVPQEDLRRIGTIECPVFYLNYNADPRAVPWKDSISHAIRVFKGTEFTITRPRDLWASTSEMFGRIIRTKRENAVAVSPSLASPTSLKGESGAGNSSKVALAVGQSLR